MSQEKDDATLPNSAWNTEILPEQFLDKMKVLQAHSEQLQLYTADINLLMKRFNVEKSLFGRVASSFASMRWWQKVLIGIVIAVIFALIGIPISLPWVIALPIIALVLYAVVVYLFEDYAKSDRKRFAQLTEGIIRREAEMQNSVLELQATEKGIHALIDQLKDFGHNYEAVIECFNVQAKLLAEQVQRYRESVEQFEQLKLSFSDHAQIMKANETTFSSDLNQVSESLHHEFQRIKENTNKVAAVTERLHTKVEDLTKESAIMQDGDQPLSSNYLEEFLDDSDPYLSSEEDSQRDDEEREVQHKALIQDFDTILRQCKAQLPKPRAESHVQQSVSF